MYLTPVELRAIINTAERWKTIKLEHPIEKTIQLLLNHALMHMAHLEPLLFAFSKRAITLNWSPKQIEAAMQQMILAAAEDPNKK